MRILFIGGTRFVGRAVAEHAAAAGHEVTVLHRGTTSVPGVESILADRESDLSALPALAGRAWDATVDVCAYRPHQVDAVADALGERAGRYLLVSTVSVYAEDIPTGSDELAMLADTTAVRADPAGVPIDANSYGPLKVMCEQRAAARFDEPLIIRPTYVVGPHDYTMRFPAWVRRVAVEAIVDCPGPSDAAMQYVDARDQAAFIVGLLERGATGAYHCAAPPTTFGAMLEQVRAALGAACEFRWLSAAECAGRESEFPLWAGGESSPMLSLDPAKAVDAGLRIRDFADTVRDTHAWLAATGA